MRQKNPFQPMRPASRAANTRRAIRTSQGQEQSCAVISQNRDTCVKEVPAERRAAAQELRDLYCVTLTGFEESMEYGGPCYRRNGVIEDGFFPSKLGPT